MIPTITCFGEVLWDLLPTARHAGGALMNVASGLSNFGLSAQLISRVGSDELGLELLDTLINRQLSIEFVQMDTTQPTGVAQANIDHRAETNYTIAQPVAWDYIHLEPAQIDAVRKSDLFVYGSLAARSSLTCETLFVLLDAAQRTVFDVNLRAPHYQRASVEELLYKADIVKVNEQELIELSGWYNQSSDWQKAMESFYERYGLETLCVTLGEKGAAMLNQTGFVQQSGFPVDVKDTIGSGDAFLAGLLCQILHGVPSQQTLEFACATGAYMATQHGATAPYSEPTIHSFLKKYSVNSFI